MILFNELFQFELFTVSPLFLRLTNKDGQNKKANDREQ